MHRFNMWFKSIFAPEFIAAMAACERIFAGVMKQMGSQLSRLYEAFRAVSAFVRAIACVDFHVSIECLFCRESSIAL